MSIEIMKHEKKAMRENPPSNYTKLTYYMFKNTFTFLRHRKIPFFYYKYQFLSLYLLLQRERGRLLARSVASGGASGPIKRPVACA